MLLYSETVGDKAQVTINH